MAGHDAIKEPLAAVPERSPGQGTGEAAPDEPPTIAGWTMYESSKGGLLSALLRDRRKGRASAQAEPAEAETAWDAVLPRLDFAFQPIVNIHSGTCFGYEALLRHHDALGHASQKDFFDACHGQSALTAVERRLHDKALEKFTRLGHHRQVKLFLNIDSRNLGEDGIRPMHKMLGKYGLAESAIAFEVSERHPLARPEDTVEALRHFKRANYRLAIDDFGTGFSGLHLLYYAGPDFLKIDRFFIADIATDSKKKLFLSHIVNIAHLLGVVVIAEGVETEREFFACKDIGCDLVQGFLIQEPTTDLSVLKPHYDHIEQMSRSERRVKSSDQKIIYEQIEIIDPIRIDAEMLEVFERFRGDKAATFFPVIDETGQPVGIVHERDLKEYTYSLYGKELITNKSMGRKLRQFITRCPMADINTKAEKILESFSAEADSDGVIIVDSMKYVGFLSARSLLRVINEKNLAAARDQNPLTKLAGNNVIHEYLSQALNEAETHYVIVYFDFDNFKPFNDKYGFRLGDRAILLFADILRKAAAADQSMFIGHVGGDDFFAAFRNSGFTSCLGTTARIVATFKNDVESFYDDDARKAGHITAQDRTGAWCDFPLLSVSAAVLDMPAGRATATSDEISHIIADLKKRAKKAIDKIASASLAEGNRA